MPPASPADRYVAWLLARRRRVLAAMLALALAAAAGLPRLSFDDSYQVYFRPDNPDLVRFRAFERTFGRGDNVLVVLAPAGGEVFTPRVLDLVRRLTRDGWQVPHAGRVDSLANFQHSEARGDTLHVGSLIPDGLTLDGAALARIRRIALGEPLLVRRLVSPAGDVTAVNIQLNLPGERSGEAAAAVNHVRRLLEEYRRRYPEVDFRLTGGAVMDVAFPEATRHDLVTIVPGVFVAIVAALWLLLRSAGATFITVAVITLAAATGMGLAGWAGVALNPTSVGAATVIATLAVADSVHILTTVLAARADGAPPAAAVHTGMRLNLRPVFLTSLTTVIGFLSMNVSDSPPFNDLGNITAAGITAAFIYSVTLVPVLAVMLPMRVPQRMARERRFMAWLADRVVDHRRLLLWGIGAGALVLAAFIPRIELDDRFVEYFSEDTAFRQDTEFTARRLTGIYAVEYPVDSGVPGGIHEPAYLRTLDAFVRWLAAQPEVEHVTSILPVLRRLNRNMHGDDPAWYRLPDSRRLAAQYLLLYELSLPYGLDLTNMVNLDKSASRVRVVLRNLGTRELREFEARAAAWLARHAPEVTAVATGPSLMFAHLSARNVRTMLVSTALAVVLIALTLVIALRSVRLGLLSLVPNLLPGVMAFGVWAVLVGRVGLVVSVISAMALGIIVDDTVHFLSKYRLMRRDHDPRTALRATFVQVGTAIWITTAVLTTGFLLLTLSDFSLSADTGLITALTLAFALAGDLLFLPPLLLLLERRPWRRGRG